MCLHHGWILCWLSMDPFSVSSPFGCSKFKICIAFVCASTPHKLFVCYSDAAKALFESVPVENF